jgi:6-phosphogluconolactonase
MSVRIYPTRGAAARALATQFTDLAEKATTARQRFTVALTGGQTPREAYRLIATDEFARQIAWSQTYVFWMDERAVPLEHPDNNAFVAKDALLNHVPLPITQIFRIQSQRPPEQAADDYEAALKKFFTGRLGMNIPRFDLIILGIGEDGHIASLYPGTPALAETERWAVANPVPQLDMWRITLTFPVISAAATVIFYVLGEHKASIVKRVLTPPPDESQALPAQRVRAANIHWILDKAAASQLEGQA